LGLLSWLGPEYWGRVSLGGGPRLELLWLGLGLELLGLLRLGLEELLLLLLWLELLLLKLLGCRSWSLWSVIAPTKEIVKGVCDPRKEAILGVSQR